MRNLLYIGICFLAVACHRDDDALQSGDLLFQVTKTSQMTEAISAATVKNETLDFTHVGIAITTDGADSILEASTESGVRIVPLAEFLNDAATINGKPAVVAMRLRDTTGISQAVQRARKALGAPYDYAFLPDNGKIYCSELVRNSYLRADGSPIFTAHPMNFRAADGTMPQFWTDLFARQGIPVPQGIPGTNPNDLSKEPTLKVIHEYYQKETDCTHH